MLTSGGETLALGPKTCPPTDQVWSRRPPPTSFYHYFDSFMVIFILMSREPVCWPQGVPGAASTGLWLRTLASLRPMSSAHSQSSRGQLDRGTRASLLTVPHRANTG